MKKQVNKEEFWKWRLQEAKENGRLFYSVYLTSDGDWEYINKSHREIFEKEVKDTDKILDAGCGYGRWSQLFDNYTGVDFSPDFIAQAKNDFPNKEFLQANLKELPFKDNEFDVAFCVSIKEMIVGNLGSAEWEAMAKELKRVAKKVLILEYTNPEQYEKL